MTNSKTLKTAAVSSTANASLLRPSTLLLAAAIAFEVAGMRALPQDRFATDAVASVDGTDVGSPVAMKRAGTVEVRIVAQADIPAR